MNPSDYILTNMIKTREIPNSPLYVVLTNQQPNDDNVIGFYLNKQPIAVSLSLMEDFKVVILNNLSITYCPLSKSGMIYFNKWRDSGYVYNNNMVLLSESDLSGSPVFMPQIMGLAVSGNLFNQSMPKIRVYRTTKSLWENANPNTKYLTASEHIDGIVFNKPVMGIDSLPNRYPLMHYPPFIPFKSMDSMVVGFTLNKNHYCIFSDDVVSGNPIYVSNPNQVMTYGSVKAPNSIVIKRNSVGSIDVINNGKIVNAIECYFFSWYADYPNSYIMGQNLVGI